MSADPVLLRHLLWQAVATGLPLQIGTADPGPGPLTDFLNFTFIYYDNDLIINAPGQSSDARHFMVDLNWKF